MIFISLLFLFAFNLGVTYAQNELNPKYLGVAMKGYHTASAEHRETKMKMPINYYEDSMKLISDAGMNHIRYVFYWESYIKNPDLFMKEMETVADIADRYNISVLYDAHCFHTSSWLNPQRGTCFPSFLFNGSSNEYPYSSGGGAKYESAKSWWTDWWNRSIKDHNGSDGWILFSEFYKDIVTLVDSHPSTLGYEILNEPQVHDDDQWEKVGEFNTFMVNELRKYTNKTIVYSQQIPASINDKQISVNAENMAKMAPQNKENVVFKITTYGIPDSSSFQLKKFNEFSEAAELAGVPVYIGEWNDVERVQIINEEGNQQWIINDTLSDLTQHEANQYVDYFDKAKVWGWAFWNWNFAQNDIPNFNLITTGEDGRIQPTKYYHILKNSISYIKSQTNS